MTAADKQNSSWFSRNKLGKKTGGLLVLGFISVMLVSVGISQSSGTPTVSIGDNGIQINGGGLDMGGTDISDGGVTIWDASAGVIPESAVNVSQVDLSTAAGSFLTWDSTNEVFDVDAGSIQSGTTASNVGLGNVENENALAQNGSEPMNGNLDLSSNSIVNVGGISNDGSVDNIVDTFVIEAGGSQEQIRLRSDGIAGIVADKDGNNGGPYSCSIDTNAGGDWICDGSKSWAHDLENGSEAIYTSQESPQVRAVYEGKAYVEDKKTIELPSHYSKTVSNTKPMLRAQVTPQGTFTKAVVMDKTDDNITIQVGEPTEVNYRITGIREGYEDRQVVRPKDEQ